MKILIIIALAVVSGCSVNRLPTANEYNFQYKNGMMLCRFYAVAVAKSYQDWHPSLKIGIATGLTGNHVLHAQACLVPDDLKTLDDLVPLDVEDERIIVPRPCGVWNREGFRPYGWCEVLDYSRSIMEPIY